jgi:hypothetical protein
MNRLTAKFQNNRVPYMNNQLINNNPIYMSNINDPNFHQKMMIEKENQIRNIKSINELNIKPEQITEYVIASMKIERSTSDEINNLLNEEKQKLTKKYLEDTWWKNRTNAPYKNILKRIR